MGKQPDSEGVGTLAVAIALLWHKLCSSVLLFLSLSLFMALQEEIVSYCICKELHK